jgi:protein-disulfide isomerase
MTSWRERLQDVATLVIAGSALVLVGMTVLDRRQPAPVADRAPLEVADWQQYGQVGHRVGPDDAPVTLVVFGDYECPACRAFEEILERVAPAHEENLAIVYRHLPLSQHRLAYPAARAAECAGEQGRFEAYHKLLYEYPDFMGLSWSAMAARASVPDSARFAACVAAAGPVASIDRDSAAARVMGATGTPAILVNHLLLRTFPDSAALDGIIETLNRQSRSPSRRR